MKKHLCVKACFLFKNKLVCKSYFLSFDAFSIVFFCDETVKEVLNVCEG